MLVPETAEAETQAEGEAADAASPKVTAQEIYDAVRGGSSLADAAAPYTLTPAKGTYFIGDTFEEGSLGAHALALSEGESELFKVEGTGWYVMVLDSEMDEAATDSRRDSIIAERQAAVFNETYPAWQDAAAFTVDEKVWKAVPFDTIFVIPTAAETTAGDESVPAENETVADAGTQSGAASEETTADADAAEGGEASGETTAAG